MNIKRKFFLSAKAYLFLAPFLVFFILVVAYPVVFGGYLSFFGQRGARMWYVGGGNYLSVLMDPNFWSGFDIPLFLLLVQVPLMLFISIFIALLYERVKHSQVYRLIFYLPYAIPGIIAGILWSYIFSKSMSPFIPILSLFGIHNVNFLNLSTLIWILLIIILWEWTGYTALIIYSTILSIPREYAEAAKIDGANNTQIAFYIKIPLLMNTLLILFIFNAIGALQVFNEPWMLGALVTLPPNYTPAMYIYNEAFYYGDFTYAIAMGLILAGVIFAISFFFLRTASKQMQIHE